MQDTNLKNELRYFKEEVLKDVRLELSKITSKIDSQKDSFSEKIISFETKISSMGEKILNLSNFISEENSLKEKVLKLCEFQQKTKDTLILHDSKLNNQSKAHYDSINRIDNFINNNILYNDVIGSTPNCKFRNFHHFIDYVIANITQLNKFKELIISMDLKSYKNKINSSIEALKTHFINISNETNNNISNLVHKGEEKNKELIEQKVEEMKNEIENYNDNFKNKIGSIEKDLEKVNITKDEMNERIGKNITDINNRNDNFETKLEEYRAKNKEQNDILKKSIKEIYNQIERILFKNINSSDNNFYYIQRGKREDINNLKYDTIENENIRITSRKNEAINVGNKNLREILEDKNENEKFNCEYKDKNDGGESILKQYIEGKINYEQAFHFKKLKKNKILDDRHIEEIKKANMESSNNNKQLGYSDIVNNIINNPGIKNIYNTKFKEVQNYIDKIIIGSVLNTKNKIKKPKLKNSTSSSFLKSKFSVNRNLKFEEISHLSNREYLCTSNNDILNDKCYDSIKEDMHNKKDNTLFIQKNKNNADMTKYFNQKMEKRILNGKKNFYEKLFNYDSSDNGIHLGSLMNIKKMSFIKNLRTQNDVKKSSSFDIEKNSTGDCNNNNDKINDGQKQNIYLKDNSDKIEKNNNIINIINYSNKSLSKSFYDKNSKSKSDLAIPNLFENYMRFCAPKLHKNMLLKYNEKNINTKLNNNNTTNKILNNSSSNFESEYINSNYTKKDLESIAKKQIEKSLKKYDNKEKI